MQPYGIIYQYQPQKIKPFRFKTFRVTRVAGLALVALSLGGMVGPLTPAIRLETQYWYQRVSASVRQSTAQANTKPLPKSVPIIFNPLVTEDGASIEPVDTDFGLVIPKIGVNAAVIPAVNPADPGQYLEALEKGVAHASTSYFPNEDGTVYLFSHSTNYDWFVRDLNAVFYLLKNLTEGDLVVVFYNGKRYTYRLTEKRIVAPSEISYLVPQAGRKRLILQTCWPPGSTAERLLLFADLVEEYNQTI